MKREKECKGNFKCWMKVLFRVTMDSYNYISFPVVSSSFFRYCTTTLDGSWTMSHDIWNYSTDRLLFKDDTFRDHSQRRSVVEFGDGITQAADRRADSTESSFQYIKNNILGNWFKNHRTLIRGEKKNEQTKFGCHAAWCLLLPHSSLRLYIYSFVSSAASLSELSSPGIFRWRKSLNVNGISLFFLFGDNNFTIMRYQIKVMDDNVVSASKMPAWMLWPFSPKTHRVNWATWQQYHNRVALRFGPQQTRWSRKSKKAGSSVWGVVCIWCPYICFVNLSCVAVTGWTFHIDLHMAECICFVYFVFFFHFYFTGAVCRSFGGGWVVGFLVGRFLFCGLLWSELSETRKIIRALRWAQHLTISEMNH